jgi:hypothetical protein
MYQPMSQQFHGPAMDNATALFVPKDGERAHPGERPAPFLESNATDASAVVSRWNKANRVQLE